MKASKKSRKAKKFHRVSCFICHKKMLVPVTPKDPNILHEGHAHAACVEGKVVVIKCPPLRESGSEYVGKTIRGIRRTLKEKLELSENHPVSLSKDAGQTFGSVGENYHLRDGDVIEFSRPAGKKCTITECTGCGKEHCLEHGGCV